MSNPYAPIPILPENAYHKVADDYQKMMSEMTNDTSTSSVHRKIQNPNKSKND